MTKQILVYFGDEPQKKEPVTSVLDAMQLSYIVVEDNQLHELVGYLMEVDDFLAKPPLESMHYASDLMVLHDISDEQIAEFNTRLKELNTEMKRKAMLTLHNQNWILKDLLAEIDREHMYFQYVDAIRSLLMKSSDLIIDEYDDTSWKRYEQAFYRAYESLQKENDITTLQDVLKNLFDAKAQLKKI